MLDPTTTRIPERRSGSINPYRSRPEDLDEFRREVDEIASEFEAKLRTEDIRTVLAYFFAAERCLRRYVEPRWWFLLRGALAVKEWLRRSGYSPAWSESQADDVLAMLEGSECAWCADWHENRIQ